MHFVCSSSCNDPSVGRLHEFGCSILSFIGDGGGGDSFVTFAVAFVSTAKDVKGVAVFFAVHRFHRRARCLTARGDLGGRRLHVDL